jgi:hypothetical protein
LAFLFQPGGFMGGLIPFGSNNAVNQVIEKKTLYREHHQIIERADGSKEETIRSLENVSEGLWRGSQYFNLFDTSDRDKDHHFEEKSNLIARETRIIDDGKGNRTTINDAVKKEDFTAGNGTKLITSRSLGLSDNRQQYLINFQQGLNPLSLLSGSQSKLLSQNEE